MKKVFFVDFTQTFTLAKIWRLISYYLTYNIKKLFQKIFLGKITFSLQLTLVICTWSCPMSIQKFFLNFLVHMQVFLWFHSRSLSFELYVRQIEFPILLYLYVSNLVTYLLLSNLTKIDQTMPELLRFKICITIALD